MTFCAASEWRCYAGDNSKRTHRCVTLEYCHPGARIPNGIRLVKHRVDHPSARVFFALWPAAIESAQLAQLVNVLMQHLTAHCFKFDWCEYKPHVTLLRNAYWSDAPLPAIQPICWQIRDFALVQSVPQDGLTGYRVLARFPLGAGDG